MRSAPRVTVTRVLGLLRDEGWLKTDSQRFLVISHLPHRQQPHHAKAEKSSHELLALGGKKKPAVTPAWLLVR